MHDFIVRVGLIANDCRAHGLHEQERVLVELSVALVEAERKRLDAIESLRSIAALADKANNASIKHRVARFARIALRALEVPLAVDAVDPHAASTGNPSTRD